MFIRLAALIFLFFGNHYLLAQKSTRSVDSMELAFQAFSFTATDFKASLSNNAFAQSDDGLIYIGNLNGVLEFDGSEWRILKLPSYSIASALFYRKSSDRLFVGGTNDFGYFEKDGTGVRHYHSMRELLDIDKRIPDIYQIVEINKSIYFVCLDLIIKWDGREMKVLPIKEGWFLELGNQVFISLLDKGISTFENDSLNFVNTEMKFEFDQISGLAHLSGNEFVLSTLSHGLYTFNTVTYESKKWEKRINEYAVKKYIADVRSWRDSLLLVSTYEGGLIIGNNNGDILNVIDEKKGLSSNSLAGIYFDKKDNIWTLSYYGIDVIRLSKNSVLTEQSTPEIRFVSVNEVEKPSAEVDVVKTTPSNIVFHYNVSELFSEDLEYSSYLEGVEEEWSPWTREVSQAYLGLESGEYVFHVKARSVNGLVSESVSKALSIPVPWYQSKYIIILGFLFIACAVLLTSRIFTTKLKRHNKNLEQLVKDRTVKLVEANKGLKQINAELDNFVYRSSHDLVAPLKSLKGLIHIAKVDTSPDNRAEYLNKMNSRVSKLEEFIKSIMEYSINSKQEIVKSNIELDNLVDGIVQDLKYYANADKVRLIKEYHADVKLFTDKKRLNIVLSNLITNAIKYHNYDQDEPSVTIKCNQNETHQIIDIIDNGEGIKSEYLDKIFDMFFRASDTSEGSGLGLYIVKDMITKIGGAIEVDSGIGVGTTFTVYLPIR